MLVKCSCGYYHYNSQHWSKIHGKTKKYIDPLIKLPFVGGKVWNKNEYDPTQPYPLITYKWVCQFCGWGQGHDNDCSFRINYPEFFQPLKGERKWEVPHYPVQGSWNFDDKILEWERVWKWWFKTSDWERHFTENSAFPETTPKFSYVPPRRKPKKPIQPKKEDDENTKKTLADWNKAGKITFRQWKKLKEIVESETQFTLIDLLGLLPPTNHSSTSDSSRVSTPDPLLNEISQIESNLTTLFRNYVELSSFFYPETEINELGVRGNKWKEDNWSEYLKDSLNIEDLTIRQKQVLKVFGKVIVEYYLEQKNITKLDLFKEENPNIWPTGIRKRSRKITKRKRKTSTKTN